MKRTHIKCEIWHLSGKKKQKGGFLPILGAKCQILNEQALAATMFEHMFKKLDQGENN